MKKRYTVNDIQIQAAIEDCKRRKKALLLKKLQKTACIAVVISIVVTTLIGLSANIKKHVDTPTTSQVTESIDIISHTRNDSTYQEPSISKASTAKPEISESSEIDVIEEHITETQDSLENQEDQNPSEEDSMLDETNSTYNLYNLTDEEIDLLVRAVQHETNNVESYYVNGDLSVVQQLMTASIVNRIGAEGFGVYNSTPNNLYDVLANPSQYGNLLNELSWFDSNDPYTRANVLSVLTGEVYVPRDLYFERCSNPGEDSWTAKVNFENQYVHCYTYYMAETYEARDKYGVGVYIIFGCNPGGAY